jgi:hypothetical protein
MVEHRQSPLELRMDDRLAPLRQEIDKIMAIGPIGRWTNPPTTLPMMAETVLFNADGTGLITSRSGMMGTTMQAFAWSMECLGRLVMRYGRRDDDGASGEAEKPADGGETFSETFDIEIKIQETEFAPWPVMTNRSGDAFGSLWCALSRDDPPLILPERLLMVQPRRTLLSRIRDVVSRHL